MKRIKMIITAVLFSLFLIGCEKEEQNEAEDSANQTQQQEQEKNWTCVCNDSHGNRTETNYYGTRSEAEEKCESNEMENEYSSIDCSLQ